MRCIPIQSGSEPPARDTFTLLSARPIFLFRPIKNPLFSGGGFWYPGVYAGGIRSLTMTYFHRRMPTIIGAGAFHRPVRDGKGWFHSAMVVRQRGGSQVFEVLTPHSDCLGCCRSCDLQPTALCHAGRGRRAGRRYWVVTASQTHTACFSKL